MAQGVDAPEGDVPVSWLLFETIERFERCLTISMIVACRKVYTTRIGREFLDASCECVFTDDDRRIVYLLVMKEPAPKTLRTLSRMIRIIARRGGYVDRMRDDKPSPTPPCEA